MKNYYPYKRGRIILLNFSPSVGQEINNIHYAIVMTKHDRPHNGLLTVIPLTSKEKFYDVNLGNWIGEAIEREYSMFRSELTMRIAKRNVEVEDMYSKIGKGYTIEEFEILKGKIIKDERDIETLKKLESKYKNIKSTTYAKVNQITTISKDRIINPLGKRDPLSHITLPDELLDLIDSKLKELFINKIDEN